MWTRIRTWPLGAIVGLLVVALLVMGGSAVGASLVTSKQIRNGTIQVKDLSRKARAQLKGRRGPAGPQGIQGATGPAGARGLEGAQGSPGSARAFARVDDDTGLDAARSQGFTAMDRPTTGLTCLTLDPATGIDKTKTVWSATVDYNASPGNAILAFAAPGECEANQIGVRTAEVDGGTFSFVNLAITVVVP